LIYWYYEVIVVVIKMDLRNYVVAVGQVAHGAAFLEPNHHASNEKKK
jgi:hypothetical protein